MIVWKAEIKSIETRLLKRALKKDAPYDKD